METVPLKSFATWARTALIREVTARISAVLAPASRERVEKAGAVAALERDVAAGGGDVSGRAIVADKVAYTWFNRIIALRFMDANGYTGTGVVSPQRTHATGQPEVLADAKRGVVDAAVVTSKGTIEAIIALLDGTRRSDDPQGEAYALLLTEYCRHWNRSMPFMFEREGDYTELLIPSNLLADDSVLARAAAELTHEVCQDVEVIGWLYQFYIAERKDEVFAGFKKNKKAGAAEIPAATQLFTPHWIVRYLVENSLGRLWMLNHPSSRLAERMTYYVEPGGEETDFLRIRSPKELKAFDPACGSGHLLTYAFDLLHAIYEEEGYPPAEIAGLILEHNLFGVEIDQRAGALAAFALTMKAAEKRKLFLRSPVQPHIRVLEKIYFDQRELDYLWSLTSSHASRVDADQFWNTFEYADTVGSLIRPKGELITLLEPSVQAALSSSTPDLLGMATLAKAERVLSNSKYLARSYEVVIANPPYMGATNMTESLSSELKSSYPHSRQDLYSCFVDRALEMSPSGGFVAMITGDTWLALTAFEAYRGAILRHHQVVTLAHLRDSGNLPGSFGSNTAFVLATNAPNAMKATFVRLEPTTSEQKSLRLREALTGPSKPWVFQVNPSEFKDIPGAPFSYQLPSPVRRAFGDHPPLNTIASPRQGIKTGDNARFLRYWWEVSRSNVGVGMPSRDVAGESGLRWFPCQKGGEYRRWFGNDQYVVDWLNDGASIRSFKDANGKLRSRPQNLGWLFQGGVTWGTLSSGPSSFRISPPGTVSESKGAICYVASDSLAKTLLAYLNSSIASTFLSSISPTIDYGEGAIGKLPVVQDLESTGLGVLAQECIEISAADWITQETAPGFHESELIPGRGDESPIRLLDRAFALEARAVERTRRLHALESGINVEVANQFGLDGDVGTSVELPRVSLLGNAAFRFGAGRSEIEYRNLTRAAMAQDLISYAVGCMLGRYSLDAPGLMLADQGSTLPDYLARVPNPTFAPDRDNVIPLVDGDWFEDDIVARFRLFLRTAFGAEYFEENLRFVTESLGVKNLRDYFIRSFYKDHVQRYRKRPIYWLFSSPKGSFNALIYMHRYTPSTVSVVLNEYLREFKAKLESSRRHYERVVSVDSTARERAAAEKELERLRRVMLELDEYEHHVLYPLATQQITLDLDEGVKANYPKLGAALKSIPGLEASDE